MKKLSVIIPVYNVEEYLEECLNSVCNQTLTDIEIICVNDGSTDNSGDILQDFAKQDTRIQIINQENAGLSAARNTGLKYATGEYITFLDSDDWISLDYYETLYNSAKENDADIAVGNVISWFHNAKMGFGYASKFSFSDMKDVIVTHTDKNNILQSCAVWNKIYKRELIFGNNLTFYHGKMVEDFPFTFLAVALAGKIVCCPFTFLYYRQRGTSIMQDPTKQVRNALDVLDNYKTLYSDLQKLDVLHKDYYINVLKLFALQNLLAWAQKIPKKQRNAYCNNVRHFITNLKTPGFGCWDSYWTMVYKVMRSDVMNKMFNIKYTQYKTECRLFFVPLLRIKNIEQTDMAWLLFGLLPIYKTHNQEIKS